MNPLSPILLTDFYKQSHRLQYPANTQYVYSTWTPRDSRIEDIKEVVVFGQQAFIAEWLVGFFNDNFFNQNKKEIIQDYERFITYTLGVKNPPSDHIGQLHDLGYLPLSIKSLPEGSVVPMRVPIMTVQNTHPDFAWLTNYIETLASAQLWKPSTSATIALRYRKLLDEHAMKTVGNTDFVQFQGHDFSFRGMSSVECAMLSGMGHLLSFVGTDTIPAIQGAEWYYGANIEEELVGTSIPATEHSVQCAYGDDMAYFERIITEVHPSGFVSIVSDGYDFWSVIDDVLPALKDKIMARDGRVVIRPDSGDPVDIICGANYHPIVIDGASDRKGAVERLWEIFGGKVNDKGYKELDPHIGLIYGDSITIERCRQICNRLEAKGFASTNVVYGIGSYTYQYNTRDTFGWAMKSTCCVIDGKEIPIFKDPKTDSGIKKSQKGRVAVKLVNGKFTLVEELGLNDEVLDDCLVEIFRDGKMLVFDSFSKIRKRLHSKEG